MTIVTLGLDLGKNWIHVVALDAEGRIVLRRRVGRDRLLKQTVNMPACLIGMEACCGAHHLGRALAAQGHTVRLMPPQYVKPFVKSNKNDYRDAEAGAEAVQRPTMRFVPLKSEAQLDLQTIHRVRQRLVGRRTALINQLRAILLERGITVPQRRRVLEARLPAICADEEDRLSPRVRHLIEDLRAEWGALDGRIAAFDAELAAAAKRDDVCRRLCEIPGIGALNATALVAAVGNGTAFEKGRDLAAWLGLVPREYSTRPGVSSACSASANGGTSICALSWCTVRALPCRIWQRGTTPSASGCGGLSRATGTSPSWRWPTSWRGSPGRCSPANAATARGPTPNLDGRHARETANGTALVCGHDCSDGRTVEPASRKPGSKNGLL